MVASNKAKEELINIADMTIGWSLSENNTVYLVGKTEKIKNGEDEKIIDKVGFGLACFAETEPFLNPPEEKSIERKKLGQDTNDNSVDFRISAEPTPKASSPKVSILDATDYMACMGGSSPGTMYYYLKIKWQSPSRDIDFYQVQYKLNDGDWQDWLAQTTDTENTFRVIYDLFKDRIYYFRVRAKDQEGNIGNWAQIEVDLRASIVINEVSLFGTDADNQSQWIELYNKSEGPINITGWKLISGHDSYWSNSLDLDLQGIIPAHGYFLLEKADDNVISDIQANQIFFTGSVYPSGHFYLLDNKNRQVDTFYIPFSGWYEDGFIQGENHYSMERISPYAFSAGANWKLNDGQTISGQDRNGNPIYGTPGSQNSNYQLYTPIFVDFVEDTVLTKDLSPYVFYNPVTTVFEDKTLTIESGTVLEFHEMRSGLGVRGTLKAIGTQDSPIIFKSYWDDVPSPGHWAGIEMYKTSKNSELENVVVQGAGATMYYGSEFSAGIRVDQTSISLKNSIIERNSGAGLRLTNSNSTIDTVHFFDHQIGGDYDQANGKGILVEGGRPSITNSNFERNYYGIYISNWFDPDTGVEIPASPILENNTFNDNNIPIEWPPLPPIP